MALTQEQREVLQQMLAGRPKQQTPVSMAQTQSPLIQANPVMQTHLDSMLRQRAANPISAPLPGGTPTQRRVEADAAQARWEREFAANERHRAAQSARQGDQSVSSIQEVASMIKATTDAAARQGRPFSDVVQALQAPNSLGALQHYGVDMDKALQLARQYYEPMLNNDMFGSDMSLPLSAGPENLTIAAQPLLRKKLFDLGLGFDAQTTKMRQDALDRALQEFQNRFRAQSQKVEEGSYRDPITGQIYYMDKYGNKTYAGTGIAGGVGGLGGLGK